MRGGTGDCKKAGFFVDQAPAAITRSRDGRVIRSPDQRLAESHSSALGLYLHVPFCSAICSYCNFNRVLLDVGLKREYVRALEGEIRRAADGSPADTIYFGGGTPSLLEPGDVARLVGACRDSFTVDPDAEVTLELNPETADAPRLSGLRAAGINRLSVGVQSFREEELRRLGRLHTADRARETVSLARRTGFTNVSVDLMMWLPQQTLGDWGESVDELVRLAPDHASLYLLELYPNAPLREEMARRRWTMAPDEDAAEMYLLALARLEEAGYAQYEISNVARPGKRSRHNLKYWTDQEWLGFGCGAHSTRNGVRWTNTAATGEYVRRVHAAEAPLAERRVLAPHERVEEALFMGLRLADGVDADLIEARYGVDVWARYGDALAPFLDAGLVLRERRRLKLSRRGMLLANEVMAVFIEPPCTIEYRRFRD